MVRAIKLLSFFTIAIVVLHYIGPATRLAVESAPAAINFLIGAEEH